MRPLFSTTSVFLLCMCSSMPALSESEMDSPWPREIVTSKGTVVIYQPQPHTLDGNHLEGRAAVALELNDSDAPVFGAVWLSARLVTDRAERTATLADISVTRTRFPEQDGALATDRPEPRPGCQRHRDPRDAPAPKAHRRKRG